MNRNIIAKKLVKLAKSINSDDNETFKYIKNKKTEKSIKNALVDQLEKKFLDIVYGFVNSQEFKKIIKRFEKVSNSGEIVDLYEDSIIDIEQGIVDIVNKLKNN